MLFMKVSPTLMTNPSSSLLILPNLFRLELRYRVDGACALSGIEHAN
jgi:hypothetical protein